MSVSTSSITTNAPEAGGYAFAQSITGIKLNTLYSLVHHHRIPHVRVSGRMVLFQREALTRWMSERAVEVAAP
ncbi:MAG: helix-turn-helix domain-containing protein [Deltaproteobacteria bacterium]|jgi:excisionase family DNA binding protein|nr:helix-turn-helix domain-containing protein [Deltaproteobacteria bacterium]MBK7067165.1 helix-turn-helix domain-containing protein [Deltaproteobacteria bacterium]MBP6830343.1 helix-turn-helix domain-containing protein [Deltaproteobacteria bacterium]